MHSDYIEAVIEPTFMSLDFNKTGFVNVATGVRICKKALDEINFREKFDEGIFLSKLNDMFSNFDARTTNIDSFLTTRRIADITNQMVH